MKRLINRFGLGIIALIIVLFAEMDTLAQSQNFTQKHKHIISLLNTKPDSAIHLIEILLESHRLTDSTKAKANFYMGQAYYYKGLYYTSGEHFKDALNSEYAFQNKVFKSKCYNELGKIYDLTDQYDLALKNYISALKINKELGDKSGIHELKINIGLLYNNINQYDKAKKYLRDALQYFVRTNNLNGEALTLKNLAKVAKNQGKTEDAKEKLQRALDIYERQENTYEYVNVLIARASIEILDDNFQKASRKIDEAFTLAEENDYSHLQARCQLTLAKLMIGKGNFYIAYEYLRDIKSYNRRTEKEKHLLMIQAASQTHNFQNLKNELSKYAYFRDSLKEKNTNMIVNELHIKYDTKNRIRKIKNQEEELIKNRRRLISALIIIFILAILLVIIISYHRKLQKSYKEIYQKEKQVQSEFARRINTKSYSQKENDAKTTFQANNGDAKLWESILYLMKEKEYYLNPELTLNDLAKACKSNRSYISKTIKSYSNQNFCTFVNRFRIEKAKSLLQEQPEYTQESIASLSGFKSTATFYRIFKNYTGLPPRKYMSLARKS